MTLTVAADGGSLTVEPKGSDAVTLKVGRVVAVGRLHVPVQLPRQDDGHRALPPRRDQPGDQALPLADPLQPVGPSALRQDHGARRPREEARVALRRLQDDGLADRHLVDERGDDRRGDVPRGRRADDRAVPEDDERLPRREGARTLRPDLRVPRPRRPLLLALPRPGAPGVRRREGAKWAPFMEKTYQQMDEHRGRRDEEARAGGRPHRRSRTTASPRGAAP